MAAPSNPSEIARETLKKLAMQRIPPSPDNFRRLYHEISGTKDTGGDFPSQFLSTIAQRLPRNTETQSARAQTLEASIARNDSNAALEALTACFSPAESDDRQAWNTLIRDLILQWDTTHKGITPARKREGLDRVLSVAKPALLHQRLQALVQSWARNPQGDAVIDDDEAIDGDDSGDKNTPESTSASSRQTEEAPLRFTDVQSLLGETLDGVIAPLVADLPELAQECSSLAKAVREARNHAALKPLLTRLRNLAFRLELMADDQAEVRHGLLQLLRLLVENVSELVADDLWLQGQIDMVREIVDQPINLRTIDDAERRIKEVIYKQSQLKHSLSEARDALKQMLAGFVDQLAQFADSTGSYHDKIEACAERVTAAKSMNELTVVLDEVMRETRIVQLEAQRTRDEMQTSRARAEEAEARIAQLEAELSQASELVRNDQLTGALNRRGLEEAMDKEMARAMRRHSTLCLGLLDIDNFKKLNDTQGHQAGDAALVHLVKVVKSALRPQDTVGRLGGEEFVILLPDTPLDEAEQVVIRLQRELTRQYFLHDNQKVLITFSAGVTDVIDNEQRDTVIERADKGMYDAKHSGKNRVVAKPASGG